MSRRCISVAFGLMTFLWDGGINPFDHSTSEVTVVLGIVLTWIRILPSRYCNDISGTTSIKIEFFQIRFQQNSSPRTKSRCSMCFSRIRRWVFATTCPTMSRWPTDLSPSSSRQSGTSPLKSESFPTFPVGAYTKLSVWHENLGAKKSRLGRCLVFPSILSFRCCLKSKFNIVPYRSVKRLSKNHVWNLGSFKDNWRKYSTPDKTW